MKTGICKKVTEEISYQLCYKVQWVNKFLESEEFLIVLLLIEFARKLFKNLQRKYLQVEKNFFLSAQPMDL